MRKSKMEAKIGGGWASGTGGRVMMPVGSAFVLVLFGTQQRAKRRGKER